MSRREEQEKPEPRAEFDPRRKQRTNVKRLEDWILYGDERDRDAMYKVFPIPRV